MAQCAQSAKTRAKPHLRFEILPSLMISQMHSNIFHHHAWHRDGTLDAFNCFAKLWKNVKKLWRIQRRRESIRFGRNLIVFAKKFIPEQTWPNIGVSSLRLLWLFGPVTQCVAKLDKTGEFAKKLLWKKAAVNFPLLVAACWSLVCAKTWCHVTR